APVAAPDPAAATLAARQPGPRFDAMLEDWLDALEGVLHPG
ncbi:MAG: class II histone deacetylase, partial [Deinococcus-Thermus bacterium]|nr:class II histone deacetylase [Deinococcota bacterium]